MDIDQPTPEERSEYWDALLYCAGLAILAVIMCLITGWHQWQANFGVFGVWGILWRLAILR